MDSKEIHDSVQRQDYASAVVRIGRRMFLIPLLLIVMVTIGNIADFDWMYAPFGYATTLQTAILISFVLLGSWFAMQKRGWDESFLVQTILVSVVFYLIISFFTPVSSMVDQLLFNWTHGKEVNYPGEYHYKTGVSTRATVLLLVCARLMKTWNLHIVRSWLLWIAIIITIGTLIGHAYQVGGVIQFMSVFTALLLFFVSASQLLQQAHRTHIKYLFNDPDTSRIWISLSLAVLILEQVKLLIHYLHHTVGHGDPNEPYYLLETMVTTCVLIGAITIAMFFVSRIAHGKKELMRQTLHIATHDLLTDTRNRLGFQEVVDSRGPGSIVGVILCDIDHFKQVNDTYGHHKGDFVLQAFAETLMQGSRDTDYVVRWGGEEFLIYTTNATEDGLSIYAEKLREAVESIDVKGIHITASFGATVCSPWENFDSAVKRADEKLYYAKRTGRNRVVSDLDDHTTEALTRETDNDS